MRDPLGLRVKICGLSDASHVRVAAEAGAAYVGFVFVAASPRAVTPDQAAALSAATPMGLATVGLFVDPDDDALDRILARAPLDMVQLHGAEPPARVAEIRSRTGLPVIKAVGVRDHADLAALESYEAVADQLLCDAKPRADATLAGGAGEVFDWTILRGRAWRRPWLLAGGLCADNLADAAAVTGARQVDVSSGVESARGVKSAEMIKRFCETARAIR